MDIKPIKTENDYDRALQEIESLFGAPIGSEGSNRLEALVVLVQDYERTHHPVGPPDVQSIAEHELDKRGTTKYGN